jgi:hypothetical protein
MIDDDSTALQHNIYDARVWRRASAIFSVFLRNGHDGRQAIEDQLEMAEASGLISEADYDTVITTDLLWNGQRRQSSEAATLVVKVSWLATLQNLEQVSNAVAVLQKIGVRAFPVVVAKEWPTEVRAKALHNRVAIIHNETTDKASWVLAQEK